MKFASAAIGIAMLVMTGAASAQTGAKPPAANAAPPVITFATQPTPAKAGGNSQFDVTVKDAKGQPIGNADVSVILVMPAMPAMKMAEMRNEVKLKPAGGGKYSGTGQIMMAGQWNVTVSVKQAGKEIGSKKLTLSAT